MHTPARTPLAALTLLATLAGSTSSVRAQAAYFEGFDDLGPTNWSTMGPQVLVNRGWVFRNQSAPLGTRAFYAGILPSTNPAYFGPQSGAGYLAADEGSTSQTGGEASSWAILPPIANQRSADAVTVWARKAAYAAQLQIRYSPTGGTSTGSGPTGVGDFTQVLLTIDPSDTGWTRYVAAAPGAGRLAVRYTTSYEIGGGTRYVGIDSLSVGPPPPPACNLPPIPAPGQTVTWTLAGGPYRVCENVTIPAGGTVNVEPGVRVDFDSGFQLGITGTMNVLGTATTRVIMDAPAVFPPFIVVQNGALNASFTDFGQQLRVGNGANLSLADCAFAGDGTNLDGGMLRSDDIPSPQPYVRLDRCSFTGSNMTLSGCVVTLRDSSFTDTYALLLRGLADVGGTNTFTGQPLQINRQDSTQPLLVDGVHASGIAGVAGLWLEGGAYLLGSNNALQGNRFALDLRGALMPGSIVPQTGNTDNVINVFEGGFAGWGSWINTGIPYRLTELSGSLPGGDIDIRPGVVVEGLANTSILVRSTRRVIAEGLPEAPITFRGVAGQHWQGLAWVTNGTSGPRMEHCHVSDANIGAVSSDNHLYVDNCLFSNNVKGASTGSGSSWFAKTLFQGNSTGADGNVRFVSSTNFNAFENNGTAVLGDINTLIAANNVWWNSPSGPRHPQNPSGTGELIGGPSPNSVSIFPFLTARPDFANTPPVVRLLEPGIHWNLAQNPFDYTAEPGTKLILRWDASDNSAIASQKVLLSPDGHYPSSYTVTLAQGLPASQRSLEVTVPDVGFAGTNQPQFVKVVSVDAQGQEGWDQTPLVIPSGRMTGNISITSDAQFVGRTFHAGDALPDVTWTGSVAGLPTFDIFVLLEADGASIGGLNVGGHGEFFQDLPNVSTDAARIAVRARGNSNDEIWFFSSGYFAIRHDPRLGWNPPAVQVTGPAPGATILGGTAVPITWTASAQQGLYGFDIQASTDGGRFWHLVAKDLPAAARSYNWQLPPSSGIADVRVRVIARDRRFQNSTSGADRVFTITPGTGPAPCYANCDGSTSPPVLNVNDFICFQSRFAAAEPYADCDHSGALNVNDFICFQQSFAAGCR